MENVFFFFFCNRYPQTYFALCHLVKIQTSIPKKTIQLWRRAGPTSSWFTSSFFVFSNRRTFNKTLANALSTKNSFYRFVSLFLPLFNSLFRHFTIQESFIRKKTRKKKCRHCGFFFVFLHLVKSSGAILQSFMIFRSFDGT